MIAIPILVNGRRWWTDDARTCVAATKVELKAKLYARGKWVPVGPL